MRSLYTAVAICAATVMMSGCCCKIAGTCCSIENDGCGGCGQPTSGSTDCGCGNVAPEDSCECGSSECCGSCTAGCGRCGLRSMGIMNRMRGGNEIGDCGTSSGPMSGVFGSCRTAANTNSSCGAGCSECELGMPVLPAFTQRLGSFGAPAGATFGCGKFGCGMRGQLCLGCRVRDRWVTRCDSGACETADCDNGGCGDCTSGNCGSGLCDDGNCGSGLCDDGNCGNGPLGRDTGWRNVTDGSGNGMFVGRGSSNGAGCGAGGCGVGGNGLCQSCLNKAMGHFRHPYGGAIPHTAGVPNTGGLAPTYVYPYYTTRGPRDFLQDNPPTIGY